MGMSTGGGDGLNSEINVTPLVDVMLVLLVIFMITAPMLNSAVELELPAAAATVTEDAEGKLILRVGKDRKLMLGNAELKWTELKEKLSTNERVKVERELYIEADKNLPYAVVVKAMALAKEAGVVKLQLVTDPNTLEEPLEDWDNQPASGASGPKPTPKQ